ncbi:MAG: aldo/keto reductase [Planctomycetes bacterium]|nr:aldo/keto reductase [Planctomycetota bacterium]
MKYRTLGKSGLRVSVVGVGTSQFSGEWGRDYTQPEINDILLAANDNGINFIDTAECYGDHVSERLVGEAVKANRAEWVIASKFGHWYRGFNNREDDFSPEAVRVQLEASLKALRSDYIDLYQFHSGKSEAFMRDELWTMLDKARRDGKVLHLGVSINSKNPLDQVEAAGTYEVETVQLVYNRLSREPEEEIFPSCMEQKLGVIARVPLAKGFLTGKYKHGVTFPKNDYRSDRTAERNERDINEVEKIRREEVPDGLDMARWALAWCLQHEAVSCVIPGCKNPDQVEKNAAAANLSEFVRDDHPLAV